MAISSHFVERFFDGVRRIERLLKRLSFGKMKTENGIPAEVVNQWWNERINNLTISHPLSFRTLHGTVVGTYTKKEYLLHQKTCKFCVSLAIRQKLQKKIKRGNNAKHNKL